MMKKRLLALILCASLSGTVSAQQAGTTIIKVTSLAEFGTPALAEDFKHLPYVNPDAPKGGEIVLSAFGTFDTLNPYVLKGQWPSSIGLTFCSLMTGSNDELSTLYAEVAESIEYPQDKSWIIFNLREDAVYHDGTKILADDFVFALETIKDHGRPFLQSFYEDIDRAEALNDRQVKYYFKTTHNMKPVILAAGSNPSSRRYWKNKDITASTLEPPLGCGPYQLTDVDPGRSVTYQRIENWWGEKLPIRIGQNNFDQIRYDYYLDFTVQFEAFKAGDIDFRSENSAKRWSTEYDLPAIESGEIITSVLPDETPRGIRAFFFNTRKDKFKDIRVRKALLFLYDFEAIQRTLLYGHYKRIQSYFPNSDFGVGVAGIDKTQELEILSAYQDQINPLAISEDFQAPVTDGSGRDRKNKRIAIKLFSEAGWNLAQGKLINGQGEQYQLEILTANPETERIALPYIENLKSVGIDASIRKVDTSQWRERINDNDFDLFSAGYNFFPPPGPELRSYYGCAAADIRGAANHIGVCDPVIDKLIEQIIAAKDLETLKATNRALDRMLLQGYYTIPLYYNDEFWIAYWNKFGKPDRKPKYSVGFPGSWWLK